jgi:hypothetical protein
MSDNPPNPAELSSSASAHAEQPPIPVQPPESWENLKEQAPMLDVHPAHHAATTWRDFFIHIATIVIGLLIAVGLEQAVEAIHHRHLGSLAAEQLNTERASNESSNEFNIFATQLHQRHLHRDLAILHAIRNHTPVPPGPFIVHHVRYVYLEDEWKKIHETGAVGFVRGKLGPVEYRYSNQDAFMARSDRSLEDLYHAAAVLRTENDPFTTTMDGTLAFSKFTKTIADSHETLSEETVEKGFTVLAEPGDLSRLTPPQIDALEHAIQVALVDDDALLTYCFNIKRNLKNSPAL